MILKSTTAPAYVCSFMIYYEGLTFETINIDIGEVFVIRSAFQFLNSVGPSERVSDAHVELA